MNETYRVGRSLGRTIYRDDELIGIMDKVDDAEMIVSLLNKDEELRDAREQGLHGPPVTS